MAQISVVATGQGMLAATGPWKRPGTGFPLESPEDVCPCQLLDLVQ